MAGLRVTTAGESHGPALLAIVEGVPAGLSLTSQDIDRDLARRQRGYGRGGRMAIERDHAQILAGVRLGVTLGSPVALLIANVDHSNWQPAMQVDPLPGYAPEMVTIPRPGHADLAGVSKTGHADIRDVLERSSARETAVRVAGGAVARALLSALGVTVRGRVVAVGGIEASSTGSGTDPRSIDWDGVEHSVFGCEDAAAEEAMRQAVDSARSQGESLGGVFEIWAWGLCPGIGGYAYADQRLDGRLCGGLASIPAVKGVEIGSGFRAAALPGSQVHDPILVAGEEDHRRLTRASNNAGGIEGGMTNGMPLIVRAAMKPIPTLTRPLASVDLASMEPADAHRERSDVEAVAAARVVGEAVVCVQLATAYLEKFGGDSLNDIQAGVERYWDRLEARGLWSR